LRNTSFTFIKGCLMKNKKELNRFASLAVCLCLLMFPAIINADDPYLDDIIITPTNPTMQLGQSLEFTALGKDQNGNPFPLYDPQWEGDTFHGTITVNSKDSTKCLFKADKTGDSYILCWEGPPYQDKHGSTDIHIIEEIPQLDSIYVAPKKVNLDFGEHQQFSAEGFDKDGNPVHSSIAPVWSTDGGSIDQNGMYTAPDTKGDFTVTAGVDGSDVTGFASVFVNDPVPVELACFNVLVSDGNVILKWETRSESNNYGFEIDKKTNGEWQKIGFVAGNGSTTELIRYEFVDVDVSVMTDIHYRLKQIDLDGSFNYSEIKKIEAKLSKAFHLGQNYPNPFNSETTISYSVTYPCRVILQIFDVQGKLAATLVHANERTGQHTIRFDANRLASGIYFYQILTNNFVDVKKMVILE